MRQKLVLLVLLGSLFLPGLASAQQTGAISGKVTATDGGALPGVTVEARSDVLPGPRMAVTGRHRRVPAAGAAAGRLHGHVHALRHADGHAQGAGAAARRTPSSMSQLGVQGVTEAVTVTAAATLIDRDTATIKSGLSNEQIKRLPVGQEYRDLIKLIPGVQYTQDTTRGPSAGGSGQDNVYQFDGVNVTLPLFGTLSAEPASHDIAQITTIKGGARAVDFDRSGGFAVDSVSKSGTSRLAGQVSYPVPEPDRWRRTSTTGTPSRYEQDGAGSTSTPAARSSPNQVFFYGSYYRPEIRAARTRPNHYGALPAYESDRNEGFGKVTLTPTRLGARQRQLPRLAPAREERPVRGDLSRATTGTGNEAWLKIGTAEGSWVINPRAPATFKYTHFAQPDPGPAGQHRRRGISTASARGSTSPAWTRRAASPCPAPIAGPDRVQRVHPAAHRLATATSAARRRANRRRHQSATAVCSTRTTSSATAGQIGYNLTFGDDDHATTCTRLPAVHRRRGSDAQLERLGPSRCLAAG